jgi:iron complex transport system substrate-binding protein
MKCRAVLRFMLILFALVGISPAAAQNTPECEDGFRLFKHELLATDPVCVPVDPQRIAFIDSSIAYGIALGVESVTRSYYFDAFLDDFPALVDEEAINAMVDIGNTWEMNAESLLGANPDLVITATWWADANDYAQTIAPTIIIDFDKQESWREGFELISQLTGRTDEQAALLADIEARITTLNEVLTEKGLTDTTFTVAIIESPTQLWTFTELNFGAELALQAGLSLADTIPTPEEAEASGDGAYAVPISLEVLPLIDADHIFLFTNYNSDVEQELFANPVWQRFAASNPDRIHFLNGEYWVRDHPISAHRIIDDLFRYIAGVEPEEVSPNPFAYTYEVQVEVEATEEPSN